MSLRRLLEGEFDDLLAEVDTLRTGTRDSLVLCMLHDSAMRIGDALNVQLDHFSPDRTLVRVVDGKWRTDKDEPDTLPVSRRTIERLERYLPTRHQRNGGPLILSATGMAMHDQHYRRLLAREGMRVLGKHVSPHMLRHTAISEAALGTSTTPAKPLPVVQKFARHRNLKTTEQYIHVDEGWAREWFAS
jgi:integrase